MARWPRVVIPGQPQHVIQRGNNRQDIFRAEDDHHFYLEKIKAAVEKHQCVFNAYVLMTNHVHLLVTPYIENSIGKMTQYFNHRYTRTATLWEGRYKTTLFDTEHYLLTCTRYIELNPVRQGW